MKNIWKYSGWYLVAVGVIHNAVGLLLGQDILINIIKDGLINTIHMEYDRNFLFWFLMIGFFWIGIGIHWQSILRTYERPLPSFLGWGVLIFALMGVMLSPLSGIWFFFPLAWMILQPHILTRPIR